jgi:hypothetical protein
VVRRHRGEGAGDPVDVPPWVERGDVEDDFGRVVRPECDATNLAHVSSWLDVEVGRGKLSGMFRRKNDLIYTPRVGEEGYTPPDNPADYDGPSQVRRVTPLQLANRVDASVPRGAGSQGRLQEGRPLPGGGG